VRVGAASIRHRRSVSGASRPRIEPFGEGERSGRVERMRASRGSGAAESGAMAPISQKFARGVMITVVVLACTGLLLRALFEVWRGHGAEVYSNVYGLWIHWTTVLTFAAALLIAIIGGLALRWWQRRDDRPWNVLPEVPPRKIGKTDGAGRTGFG
jgi:hypothetical protein